MKYSCHKCDTEILSFKHNFLNNNKTTLIYVSYYINFRNKKREI